MLLVRGCFLKQRMSYKGGGQAEACTHSCLMLPSHAVCVEEHNGLGSGRERDLQEGDTGVQLPSLTNRTTEIRRDCFRKDCWVNFGNALWGCREREPGVWCPLVDYRYLNWSYLEGLRGLRG